MRFYADRKSSFPSVWWKCAET